MYPEYNVAMENAPTIELNDFLTLETQEMYGPTPRLIPGS